MRDPRSRSPQIGGSGVFNNGRLEEPQIKAADQDDECVCEHERYLHDDGQGACIATASSGYACACPSFSAAN